MRLARIESFVFELRFLDLVRSCKIECRIYVCILTKLKSYTFGSSATGQLGQKILDFGLVAAATHGYLTSVAVRVGYKLLSSMPRIIVKRVEQANKQTSEQPSTYINEIVHRQVNVYLRTTVSPTPLI